MSSIQIRPDKVVGTLKIGQHHLFTARKKGSERGPKLWYKTDRWLCRKALVKLYNRYDFSANQPDTGEHVWHFIVYAGRFRNEIFYANLERVALQLHHALRHMIGEIGDIEMVNYLYRHAQTQIQTIKRRSR